MAEYTSMVQPVRELAAAEYGETVADLRIEGLNSGSAAIVLLLTSVATCLVVIRIRSQTVFARHISGWRFLSVHRRFLIANSRALGGATAPVPPRPPGHLFQDYALIDNTTVRANPDVARRTDAAERSAALERVGLGGREKETVHHLSGGGEQQRVALARPMVKKPSVVLADEPTGALDEANTAMVMEVLGEMARHGCAVVIATHVASLAKACDDVFDVSKQEFRTKESEA